MEKEFYYHKLRTTIEKAVGQEIQALTDFAHLEEALLSTVGQRLSPTTLRRFWGYQEAEKASHVSRNTLNTLATFAGYTDFESFCQSVDSPEDVQSGYIHRQRIQSQDLEPDESITITWNPGRRIQIRHLGNSRFIVEESISSKLQVGDTFTCHLFLEHECLYITDIIRGDKTFSAYVCGRQDGILFHKMK